MHSETGWLALIALLATMFVVDPILSAARRRWSRDYPRYAPPKRLFRRLGLAVPALSAISSAVAFSGSTLATARALGISALLFVASCLLGRYFFDRSQDRLARLPGWVAGANIEPDDPEFSNDLWDTFALLMAIGYLLSPFAVAALVKAS